MPRKMKAPNLCDEASVGTTLYHVDNDGTVEAADDDVGALAEVGFSLADAPAPEQPDGTATMKAPAGAISCAWAGVGYDVGADGLVTVPAIAVADLSSHGFVPVAG